MGQRWLRSFALVLAVIAGTLVFGGLASRQAEDRALEEDSRRGGEQLAAYATALQTLIDRFSTLPAVLALDPELIDAVERPLADLDRQAINRKLETLNQAAGSSSLDLLDRNGLSLAASNWRLATSYVGHDYGFRPYFQQTRNTGSGRYYAVGVTSGQPGYFLSSAIHDRQGGFAGALVVKLEFPDLEREWQQGRDILLVSDAKGIVFIANRPGWRFRQLRQLSGHELDELQRTRQYDRQALQALPHERLRRLGERSELARTQGPDGEVDYLWESLPLPEEGWTLHLLRPASQSLAAGHQAAIAAAAAWLCLVFLGMFVTQRLRLLRLRRQTRAELEALVEARTTALRQAQDGLVQAAKLAALGQMSAAMAHEISQPLTAQAMHLASLRLLLEQGRTQELGATLGALEQLAQRLVSLTRHLKTYARHSPAGVRENLDLCDVLERALGLLQPRLRSLQVEVVRTLPDSAPVRGDGIRLEQLVINLLSNALDAIGDKSLRKIAVQIHTEGGECRLRVWDSGGGIAPEHLSRIFDPFFTTKPIGQGLGLGLSVSQAIAEDAGGTLVAHNEQQGACLTLILPAAPETP